MLRKVGDMSVEDTSSERLLRLSTLLMPDSFFVITDLCGGAAYTAAFLLVENWMGVIEQGGALTDNMIDDILEVTHLLLEWRKYINEGMPPMDQLMLRFGRKDE